MYRVKTTVKRKEKNLKDFSRAFELCRPSICPQTPDIFIGSRSCVRIDLSTELHRLSSCRANVVTAPFTGNLQKAPQTNSRPRRYGEHPEEIAYCCLDTFQAMTYLDELNRLNTIIKLPTASVLMVYNRGSMVLW